jgi:hypothetical protein
VIATIQIEEVSMNKRIELKDLDKKGTRELSNEELMLILGGKGGGGGALAPSLGHCTCTGCPPTPDACDL